MLSPYGTDFIDGSRPAKRYRQASGRFPNHAGRQTSGMTAIKSRRADQNNTVDDYMIFQNRSGLRGRVGAQRSGNYVSPKVRARQQVLENCLSLKDTRDENNLFGPCA